jgi:multidrug resistance efflux pump
MDSNTDQPIEIRNEPIQDIIGRPPGWITRWGTTAIFGFLAALIVFASVFRYPDSIKSGIVITTENPPVNLMAHSSGNLKKIFVADNQLVQSGDLLTLINNPADYHDVLLIRQWTEKSLSDEKFQHNADSQQIILGSFQLGEIQPALSAYFKCLSDVTDYLKDNPEIQRIAALKQESAGYADLRVELARQCEILKKEFELINRQHERNKILHRSGTISDADLEKSESVLLAKEYEYAQSKIELANNRLRETGIQKEIVTLESELMEHQHEKERILHESLLNLSAEIAAWENRYVLKAPVEGKVSFSKVWDENQPVSDGDLIMTVIPQDQGMIIGKLRLPMEGAGKVKEGQQVVIKLDNYPYLEFGLLRGYVRSIADAPDGSVYMVQVNLKDSMLTSYGKIVDFHQEMQGQAEIITENLTLMKRLLNPIRHIMRRQKTI